MPSRGVTRLTSGDPHWAQHLRAGRGQRIRACAREARGLACPLAAGACSRAAMRPGARAPGARPAAQRSALTPARTAVAPV